MNTLLNRFNNKRPKRVRNVSEIGVVRISAVSVRNSVRIIPPLGGIRTIRTTVRNAVRFMSEMQYLAAREIQKKVCGSKLNFADIFFRFRCWVV